MGDENAKEIVKAGAATPVVFEGGKLSIIRKDERGRVRAFKKSVVLTPGTNMCVIQKKPIPFVSGVYAANRWAGVSVQLAEYTIVDGVKQHNPFTTRDPNTGEVKSVHATAQAVGYSPTGNVVFCEASVYLDLRAYKLQEFFAKLKKHHDAGAFGVAEDKPKQNRFTPWSQDGKAKEQTVQLRETLKFIPIDEFFGLWVDYSHPAIKEVNEAHANRIKSADRIAQSIAKRNALIQHPAFGGMEIKVQKKDGHETYYTEVYGTIPIEPEENVRIDEALRAAKAQGAAAVANMGGEVIDGECEEIKYDTDSTLVEDVVAEQHGESDHRYAGDQQQTGPAAPAGTQEDIELDLGDGAVFAPETAPPERPAPTPKPGRPAADALTKQYMQIITEIYEAQRILGDESFNTIVKKHFGDDDPKKCRDLNKLGALKTELMAAADNA